MWLLALALFAVVAWLALRRPSELPKGSTVQELAMASAVAASALTAIRETDELLVNAWQKLERMIQETPNPVVTCLRMTRMRKDELPRELVALWQYIDDLTERSNRRAEHYETVAHAPAPPLDGRAVSAAIMGRIRSQAASAESAEAPRADSSESDATVPDKAAAKPSRAVLEAMQNAKALLNAHTKGGGLSVTAKDVAKLSETAVGLTQQALQLMALHTSVLAGAAPPEKAMEVVRKAIATYKDLLDAPVRVSSRADGDAARRASEELNDLVALHDVFLEILEDDRAALARRAGTVSSS